MHRRSTDFAVVFVSLASLAYNLIVRGQLLLGIVIVLSIMSPYMLWRQGDSEQAMVLLVLWGIVAAAIWAGSLWIVISAIIIAMLGYIGWNVASIRRQL